MKYLRKIILLFVLSLSLFIPGKAQAIAKFNTTYQIYYVVNQNGSTHVKFLITQKNNLSVVYATEYGISINGTKIENVRVLDEGVTVKADVIKTLNQTSISFPFINKVVGKDKVHNFTIEYDTADIATKNGNTWQVDIPRLEPNENLSEQSVVLVVPANFPVPAYIDPKPDMATGNTYTFSGSKLGNKSISAVFGKTQYYRGTLHYHLQNNQGETATTDIALPPDTSYQTVYITSITPKPLSVRKDSDGNIMARYLLKNKEKLDIKAEVIIKIEFVPKSAKSLPPESLTKSSNIWNYHHSIFNEPGFSNLKTPKQIFDFVSDKLTYDYEKVNRERSNRSPAAESLINSQSAICTDYTDLFVALARKAKIPARELEGFAVSENPNLKPTSLSRDVLHAWPEYFDRNKNTWIQVDPTWTSTTRGIDYFNKLDFNHIVLAIHGEEDGYPVPAGGYKNGNSSIDVYFNAVSDVVLPPPLFEISFDSQYQHTLRFKVKNNAGVSFSGGYSIEERDRHEKNEGWLNIAPFGEEYLTYNIGKTPLIGKIDGQAIIYLNNTRHEVRYTYYSAPNKTLIFSGLGGLLGLLALWAWRLHLRRQKR